MPTETQMPVMHGMTRAQYDALATKDPNAFYTIVDEVAEITNNKVTSMSASSTNTQYPSAKCVYDALQDIDQLSVVEGTMAYNLTSKVWTVTGLDDIKTTGVYRFHAINAQEGYDYNMLLLVQGYTMGGADYLVQQVQLLPALYDMFAVANSTKNMLVRAGSTENNTFAWDAWSMMGHNHAISEVNGLQTALDAKEASANKVTALSAASTDTQYPSAKCVYDIVGDIETLLASI